MITMFIMLVNFDDMSLWPKLPATWPSTFLSINPFEYSCYRTISELAASMAETIKLLGLVRCWCSLRRRGWRPFRTNYLLRGQTQGDQQAKTGSFVFGGGLGIGIQQVIEPSDGVQNFQWPAIIWIIEDTIEVQAQGLKHRPGGIAPGVK